jgi:hypothetical protein
MYRSPHYPTTSASDHITRGWHSARTELFPLMQKAVVAVCNAVLSLGRGLLLAVSGALMTVLTILGIPLALATAVALLVLAASSSVALVLLIGAIIEFLGFG